MRQAEISRRAGALRAALLSTALLGACCVSIAQASAADTAPVGVVRGAVDASAGAGQIRSLLERELAPSGKGARIGAIVRSGGATFDFKALETGTAVIEWFRVPAGAKLSRKSKPQPVLVGSGLLTFSKPGTRKMAIRLSSEGRQLLQKSKTVRLTALGNFTAKGRPAVGARKTFVLAR